MNGCFYVLLFLAWPMCVKFLISTMHFSVCDGEERAILFILSCAVGHMGLKQHFLPLTVITRAENAIVFKCLGVVRVGCGNQSVPRVFWGLGTLCLLSVSVHCTSIRTHHDEAGYCRHHINS